MTRRWYKIYINPEPWAIGPVGTGRKGVKTWTYVGQNQQLAFFQNAVKESIENPEKLDGDIDLLFLFWRQVEHSHRKNYADATNLQKATEDALQGVLYENDKNVREIHSILMQQGPAVNGRILIGIKQYDSTSVPIVDVDLLSEEKQALEDTRGEGEVDHGNTYNQNSEEVF